MITEKNIENRKAGNSLKQLKIETIKNCLLAKGLIYNYCKNNQTRFKNKKMRVYNRYATLKELGNS